MEEVISDVKVKERKVCRKCEQDLELRNMGGGTGIFDFGTGSGAFYCKNKECDFYGLLTVVYRPVVEEVEKK